MPGEAVREDTMVQRTAAQEWSLLLRRADAKMRTLLSRPGLINTPVKIFRSRKQACSSMNLVESRGLAAEPHVVTLRATHKGDIHALDNLRHYLGSVAARFQFPYSGRSDPPLAGRRPRGTDCQSGLRTQNSLIYCGEYPLLIQAHFRRLRWNEQ